MAHAVHVYRPHRSDAEVLEKISVAREPLLEEILERLAAWDPKRSRQHYVLIGPRGIGKTHFLRLIEHRIEKRPELREKWVVAALPEDFYGISRISDLLLEMVRSLGERHAEGDLARVHAKTRHDPDDDRVNDRCLDALRAFHREAGRGVVLMVENLDRLLQRQFRDRTQAHLLRRILIEEPWLVLLASSPTYLDEIANPDQPFFEFFKVQILAELSPAEQRRMLERLAAIEENLDFRAYLQEMGPRLRALYHFTGGNPRLSVMLYDLVSKREVSAVRNELDLLLDQMTPFYQDRMRDVSDQEAKILETISILPEGCTPTELAEEARLPAKTVRAVLSRLEKAGYLRRSERSKKRTYYTVPERFFRIWHQMNHSRVTRGRVQYLLEFFSSWYSTREERDDVWERLKEDFASRSDLEDGDRMADLAEYMGYLVEVSEESERFVRLFERLEQIYTLEEWAIVEEELEASDLEHDQEREYWLHRGLFMARVLGDYREASDNFRLALNLGGSMITQAHYGIELANNKDPRAESIFLEAIGSLKPTSEGSQDLRPLEVLAEILRGSEYRGLTKIAAYLLSFLNQEKAFEELRGVLASDAEGWRRARCAAALGASSNQSHFSLLVLYLEDHCRDVRKEVATALGRFGDPKATEPLIRALDDKEGYVRGRVATALGRLGDLSAVEPLIRALQDDDPVTRGSAASALGRLGDRRAVEPLMQLLRDLDPVNRSSAASALGKLGDRKAVEPLLHTLLDKRPITRGSAASALGRLGDPRAVEPLLITLREQDPINRLCAASALGRIGDSRAVEPLILALHDEDSGVRGNAAAALGRLGDSRAVEPLISALRDEGTKVRRKAVAALASFALGLDTRGSLRLVGSRLRDVSILELSRVLGGALRSAFATNDLPSAQRLIEDLSVSGVQENWLWAPFEIALEYLTRGDPAILKSQHAEMREAIQLVLDLVPSS